MDSEDPQRVSVDEEHASLLRDGAMSAADTTSQKDVGRQSAAVRYPYLSALLAVFFVSSTIDVVFNKKMAIAAGNYPYVLSQLSPFAGFAVYGCIVAYRRMATDALDALETRQVPYWKPCVVGVLFSLHNVLRNLGNRGNVVPGYITLLIAKLIVPASALLSMAPPLRRRFDKYQWAAMGVLLLGVSFTIGPTLAYSYAEDSFGEGAPFFVLLQIVAVLPLAIAMLFVEHQITRNHPKLAVAYLWMMICTAEFGLGLLFAPLSARLQFPKEFADPSVSGADIFSMIWQNLLDGLACVFLGHPTAKDGSDDLCEGALPIYAGALGFGCMYNLAMAAAVREGGATCT